MALKKLDRRTKRQFRIRKRVVGTPERPRLSVYRSIKNIYAQIVDDSKGVTLVAASTLTDGATDGLKSSGNAEAAKRVGQLIAKKAREAGITRVVFDRGGNLYHGRIKALAEGAREGGLEF